MELALYFLFSFFWYLFWSGSIKWRSDLLRRVSKGMMKIGPRNFKTPPPAGARNKVKTPPLIFSFRGGGGSLSPWQGKHGSEKQGF